MLGYNHYVPILKGKMGEFRALLHLPAQVRAKLTPFFDVPRPENRWKNRFDEYLLKKVVEIHKNWGSSRELFVDYFDIELALRTPSGQHYVQSSFNAFRKYSVQAIPVTGLDRDDDYNISVSQAISMDGRGVAIRLQKDDIEDPSLTQQIVKDLLTDLNVKKKDVHLALDFRDLHRKDLAEKVDDAMEFLCSFGSLKEWETLSLAASGFPEHMGEVQKHSSQLIPRTELDLWEQVVTKAKKKNLTRFPAFSDYGICHPDFLDFDLTMNPSANVRYTLLRNWLIVKGAGLKKKINGRTSYDYSQFFELAKRLRSDRDYFGQGYSYGDWYIYNCKRGAEGPGHLPKWREVGTNHHLTLVAEQIANSHVI